MPVVKTINRNYLNLIANFISFFSLQVGCGGGGGGEALGRRPTILSMDKIIPPDLISSPARKRINK